MPRSGRGCLKDQGGICAGAGLKKKRVRWNGWQAHELDRKASAFDFPPGPLLRVATVPGNWKLEQYERGGLAASLTVFWKSEEEGAVVISKTKIVAPMLYKQENRELIKLLHIIWFIQKIPELPISWPQFIV